MEVSRQVRRREAFQSALATMPRWEKWTTEYQAVIWANPREERTVKREHCKLIPRRIRRDMARQRSKRV